MAYVLQYVLALGVIGLLVISPGYLATALLLGRRWTPPPNLLTRATLGLAFWIVVCFCLCVAGVYHRTALCLVAITVVVAAALLWLRRGGLPRPSLPRFVIERSLLSGALTFAIPALFLVTLIPVLAWDSNTYHLTIPRLYSEHHGFRPIAFNVYSNWPLNTELLFGVALQLGDFVAAKLVHFLFGLLTLLALYRFGRTRQDIYVGLLAAVLFVGNPGVLFEFCVAYVDLAYGFFFLMAYWYVSQYMDRVEPNRGALLMGGVAAGLAAGTKMTGCVGVLCLCVLFVIRTRRRRRPARHFRDFGLMFLLPCLLLAGPWWIKSWYYTGNPVYPFFYDLFGGPDWSHDLGVQFHAWLRSMGMGSGLIDTLLLPVRVILQGDVGYDRFDGNLNRLWIVWLPVALAGLRRDPWVRHLLLTAGLYFGYWAFSSQQVRFLVPVLPLVSLAAALSVGGLLARIRGRRRRRIVATLVSLAAVLSILVESAEGIRAVTRMGLSNGVSAQASDTASVFDFINRKLPPDARIMFLNTNHGFFCRREYVADSFFEASQLGDLLRRAETSHDLRVLLSELNITHILWNDTDWGIAYPPALFELFEDAGRTALIYRSPDGGEAVYELIDEAS